MMDVCAAHLVSVVREPGVLTVTKSSIGCSSPDEPADSVAGVDASRWRPSVDDSWQWQLQGVTDLSHEVDLYDVDLFDTSSATMRALHAAGRPVVCYVSVGTWGAVSRGRRDVAR